MQQRSKHTRQHILEAALVEFSQRGFEAVSVSEICQAAGVSKGAFYHHFPSKQAIFLRLLEQWLESIDEQLEGFRQGMKNVPQGLLLMAGMAGEIFQQARGRLPLFLEFWSQSRVDPVVWQATVAPYRRYRDFFAALVRDGVAEGSLKEVDPGMAALVIVSLAVGLLLQRVLDVEGEDWGRVTNQGMNIILNGLATREEA